MTRYKKLKKNEILILELNSYFKYAAKYKFDIVNLNRKYF